MADETLTLSQQLEPKSAEPSARRTWTARLVASVLILASGTVVFVFGSNYFSLFPTNDSNLFRAVLAGFFLVAALVLRRVERLRDYAAPAYAFFIASMVFLLTSLLMPLQEWMFEVTRTSPSDMVGATVSKFYQVLVIVPLIIILTRLAGGDLGSIYLRKGDLKLGLIVGGVGLVLLVGAGLIISGAQITEVLFWISLFSFGNALMEELWLRGIFLRGYQRLVGAGGAIVLTAILFALVHFGAVYMDPAEIPMFLVYTFSLGLGAAYLIYRTDSLWGAVLLHMGADIFGILIAGLY